MVKKQMSVVEWLKTIFDAGLLNEKSFVQAEKIFQDHIEHAYIEGTKNGLQYATEKKLESSLKYYHQTYNS